MSTLYVTYCSAPKRTQTGDLPAIERYLSDRIADVARRASVQGARFAILSGEYGLLEPEDPLPWYDHLLQEDEIDAMVEPAAARLRGWGVTHVRWFTVDPALDPYVTRYRSLIERAAVAASLPFEVEIVEAND